MLQSDSPFTIPCKRALSTPTSHLTPLSGCRLDQILSEYIANLKKKIKVLKC